MSLPDRFAALRTQLTEAATAFTDGTDGLASILAGMVDDVDRALTEPLEIFPVCHHSPASGLAMVRRLRQRPPKVIYLELCEDLGPLLPELANSELPVALQAFASELVDFPARWGPLSVVAPITEASAEYQAIAYAMTTPGVTVVPVDRSADHVFQWAPPEHDPEIDPDPAAATSPETGLHGDAVGVEIGELRPRFADLEAHLLHHGRVRHWSEWWDQYVEQPLAGADYATYRQVMLLVGSLFRRLAPERPDRLARDEDRERFMWTRIRHHLAESGVDRSECLYVCGAFHAVSPVTGFGVAAADDDFEITPPTGTGWRYGLIPSSHSAIEAQFGLAGGSVSIAAANWRKELDRSRLAPFRLAKNAAKGGRRRPVAPTGPADGLAADRLSDFLAAPPELDPLDEAELRQWCVEIVRLARRNGYLASTADAIAVFETSILLAGLRNRARPTPYDFQDAAVTCIEKDAVPGRRDIARLCEILLGGDRIGTVGYDALPPLARDVHDRLAPLGLELTRRTVQRALLDLSAQPDLRACSDLLWRLHHLLPTGTVRPVMGDRGLGQHSIQESWDLALGKQQRALIELGHQGVTVEQVLEQRLRKAAWEPAATAAQALTAVIDAIRLLDSPRFADELGARAVELLAAERTVADAPQVLAQIRALLAYYRAHEPTLPSWCETFIKTGYAHYCTLLPTAFADDSTSLRQVAAMLGFLCTLEDVALSVGCDRTQLELAVRQAAPQDPARIALWWGAQVHLGMWPLAELRDRCDALLDSPLTVPAVPAYISGLVQALEPAPELAPFVVEVISKAFGRLPDPVLLPWLPTLIRTLRAEAAELVPNLVRQAGRVFPPTLPELDTWQPPWSAPAATEPADAAAAAEPPSVVTEPVATLLAAHPAASVALADLLRSGR